MEAVAATVALVVGAVLAGAFTSTFLKSFTTRRWVPTPGVVTESSIETRTERDGTNSYAPLVTYRYDFHGHSHFGNAVRLVGTSDRNRNHADEVVSAYFPGAHITVYVDGSAPSQSVLQPGIEWLAGAAVGFGMGLVAFAIAILSKS
jgi:hypothetical protein